MVLAVAGAATVVAVLATEDLKGAARGISSLSTPPFSRRIDIFHAGLPGKFVLVTTAEALAPNATGAVSAVICNRVIKWNNPAPAAGSVSVTAAPVAPVFVTPRVAAVWDTRTAPELSVDGADEGVK